MKVLYDHQTFVLQKFGGISRYFSNLYNHLNSKSDFNCELSLLYSQNYYINDKSFLPNPIGKFLLKKNKKLIRWNKLYSEKKIRRNDFDVFHPTYYDPYFLDKIKKPFVITVHDMIHELFPEWFLGNDPYVRYKRLVFEKASHFIAISESTKHDLQLIYNIADEKISVIPHGYEIVANDKINFNKPANNYILYVGARNAYKNFNRFISAITPLINKSDDISLICAGGGAFSLVEYELFLRKGLKKVKHIAAGDAELKMLYQNALVFVYPSLYEGFGLPILEAFANNCPSVISNIPPFKEVGGNGSIYFNPNDVDDMTAQIETVMQSKVLANDLKNAGKIELQKFSIATCIKKTEDVYRTLV